MQEICLKSIGENKFLVIDCETGQPIELGKKGNKVRAPSAYNLHMKECIKSKSGPITDRFKACAIEYKNKK
jgi:hypothetical protein